MTPVSQDASKFIRLVGRATVSQPDAPRLLPKEFNFDGKAALLSLAVIFNDPSGLP